MKEIEYIIHQSMNGLHVLFDNATIKRFCGSAENDDDIFDEKRAKRTERTCSPFID